ncbi:Ku protein [Streptomyces nigrescens]
MGPCKIALRQRERLAVLRPRHGVIVLQTLMWRDEVREPGDLGPSAPVSDRELQLAELLLSELTGVEMQQMEGVYRHTLEQLVAAKSVGSEVPELPSTSWPPLSGASGPRAAPAVGRSGPRPVSGSPACRVGRYRRWPRRARAGRRLRCRSARSIFQFGALRTWQCAVQGMAGVGAATVAVADHGADADSSATTTPRTWQPLTTSSNSYNRSRASAPTQQPPWPPRLT